MNTVTSSAASSISTTRAPSTLAQRAGMTQPALSHGGGGVVPTIAVLERISAALDADLTVELAARAALSGPAHGRADAGQRRCHVTVPHVPLSRCRRDAGQPHHPHSQHPRSARASL